MKRNKKTNVKSGKISGITLIALVITVIVLLLLAGVSITMLTGNNNLIIQSTKAKEDTERAKLIEEVRIDIMGVQTENKGSLGWESLKELLSKYFNAEKIPGEQPENLGEVILETTDGKYIIPLTEIYSGSLDGESKETELPSTAGTKPYLPTTEYTQVPETSLETGLVIKDGAENEYVWIEVPNDGTGPDYSAYKSSNNITDIEKALHEYTMTYRKNTDSIETSYKDDYSELEDEKVKEAIGLTKEQYKELKEKMLKSIYENGGFYIGRYETGIEDSFRTAKENSIEGTTPVIKANAYPYNYVTCMQAQQISQQFKPSGKKYTTNLMFGVQWDLVMKYLETKNVSQKDLKEDSMKLGNYKNNILYTTKVEAKGYNKSEAIWDIKGGYSKDEEKTVLLTTGASDDFSKLNIYDLPGNVSEITLEYTADVSYPCALRGGSCNSYSFGSPANDRIYSTTTYSIYDVGFRVSLY